MRRIAIAALALALVGTLLWWLRGGADSDRQAGAPEHQTSRQLNQQISGDSDKRSGRPNARANPAAGSESANHRRLDHRTLSPAFAGTDVDGELLADAEGNLVLALGVRDFFDYFLLAAKDVPLADVRAFMEAYARERLPETAVAQLMALLDDYLAYRQQATSLFEQQLLPTSQQTPEYHLETLDRTFASLKELRRQHMSENAVTAFFALEEEHGQYTLDRMAVQLDAESSPAEKAEAMAHLRERLSPGLRASETRKVAEAERAERIREILAQHGDEERRRVALAEHLSDEEVERILARAAATEAFQVRVDKYLAERATVLAAGLPADERKVRVDALRRQHFPDPQELIWARTYEARADRQ